VNQTVLTPKEFLDAKLAKYENYEDYQKYSDKNVRVLFTGKKGDFVASHKSSGFLISSCFAGLLRPHSLPSYTIYGRLCLLNATDKQIADFFGICEKTLNVWKSTHRKFLQSIKKGTLSFCAP